MDKKEYIFRQLARTRHKKDEHYVVTRIIHLLNDLDLKFVTQQHVKLDDGKRALTDLFFPQLGVHIEVDELHHLNSTEQDKTREADIVSATSHQIKRIDTSQSLDSINKQVDAVVSAIAQNKRDLQNEEGGFTPWDPGKEHDPDTYLRLGYIDVKDNVAFRRIKDACRCFGHKYKNYQKAGAPHKDPDTILWFPKLYENRDWDNRLSPDEKTITERCKIPNERARHVADHVNSNNGRASTRITFARVQDPLGLVMYRFKGVYVLDRDSSNENDGLVWRRTKTRAATYADR